MRKTALLLCLMMQLTMSAQFIKPFERTTTNISTVFDPYASYKEGGLNFGAEINYTEESLYLHSGLQFFPVLEGGYTDFTTAIGKAYKIGYFDDLKGYGGARVGFIWRDSVTPYPTFGAEIGLDYNLTNDIVIGLRSTYDYRGDFKYWGSTPEFRFNTFAKIGYIINFR